MQPVEPNVSGVAKTHLDRSSVPSLADHKVSRFCAIILLYFLQGIPVGLVLIAVPAWLAENNASPIAIGAFVGTAMLPWSLKLFGGLIMDRFTFKAMGRRRSWILLAQLFMVLSFVILAIASPSPEQLAWLTLLFFILNLCAIVNDVAVDGMTIDIVPAFERTSVNSYMFAAQTVGIAASSFLGGQLLVKGDISILALACASLIFLATIFISVFRERKGEKLFPWSKGEASPECKDRQQDAWLPILKGIFHSIVKPSTLIFLICLALSQASFTFIDAVAPVLSVQHLSWASNEYSSFASAVSLLAAFIGALVTPFLVSQLGLRNTNIGLFIALILVAIYGGVTFLRWQNDLTFIVTYTLQYVLATQLLIVTVVWSMRICNPAVAASLFALFMAVPNFSRSVMSGWSGFAVEGYGYDTTYYLVAATSFLGLLFCFFAKIDNQIKDATQ